MVTCNQEHYHVHFKRILEQYHFLRKDCFSEGFEVMSLNVSCSLAGSQPAICAPPDPESTVRYSQIFYCYAYLIM